MEVYTTSAKLAKLASAITNYNIASHKLSVLFIK